MSDLRQYSERMLNPFSGTAQIVELNNTRAISTDGITWQLLVLNEILQKPWRELRVQGYSDDYLKFGSWSDSAGLKKIPVHPTLYQENVEKQIQLLIERLQNQIVALPFVARDIYECWLLDPELKPVVLVKSAIEHKNLLLPKKPHWYPFDLNGNSFKSKSCAPTQSAQQMLSTIVLERLGTHPACAWIKRDEQRHGHVITCHPKKMIKNQAIIDNELFPERLISTEWNNKIVNGLVHDFISWQAPVLLTLDPLSNETRRTLEIFAQQRPTVVASYHRLYPKVIDSELLNKILVEATMRQALV